MTNSIPNTREVKPLNIRLFRILERIGLIAYHLELPRDLEHIHDVFHVSMLRKYISDPCHVLEALLVKLGEDLSFKVQPIEIMHQRMKVLRNKFIPMVKVLWRSDRVEKMTWEIEASMRS